MTKRPVVPCQDYTVFERMLKRSAERDSRTAAEKFDRYEDFYLTLREVRGDLAAEVVRRRLESKARDRREMLAKLRRAEAA